MRTQSTQIPPPSLQPWADSGHVGCKCPPGQRRRYNDKNDDRQTSSRARMGLVFSSCGAAFVSSLREGSAGSWLVSSEGQKKAMVSHQAEHRRLRFPQTTAKQLNNESSCVSVSGLGCLTSG